MKQKVLAYITKNKRLLVFRHTQFPEAGIQVPAGSVEPGEALDRAVLREAEEESGLKSLYIIAYLGAEIIKWEGISIQRHYFHLGLEGTTPDSWLSYENEPSDGSPGPIEFECYWVRLGEVPELAGGQEARLKNLRAE